MWYSSTAIGLCRIRAPGRALAAAVAVLGVAEHPGVPVGALLPAAPAVREAAGLPIAREEQQVRRGRPPVGGRDAVGVAGRPGRDLPIGEGAERGRWRIAAFEAAALVDLVSSRRVSRAMADVSAPCSASTLMPAPRPA